MTRQETPATATSRPQGAERPAGDTQDAATRDRPSDAHTEALARALAAAEHINSRRDTGPWDELTPRQRNGFRAEAGRATGKETER
ncbi:hypothetical protein ACWDBF_21165 [Streptomyces angustmyceticus]